MAFIIAQILGFVICGISAISMLSKNMSRALIFQVIGNLLVTVNFWLLGGFSGSIVCIIGTIQTLTLYLIRKKGDEPNKYLLLGFLAAYISASVITYKAPVDILSALAAVTFAVAVAQSKPKGYRLFMLVNSCFWIVYDFFTMAYSTILTHTIILISVIVGMIKYDLKKQEEKA